jgi:hypothetical protein
VGADAGFEYHEQRRIGLTVACRDTDAIPKVSNAGEIVTVGGRRVQVMHNGVLVEADGYYGPWMTEIIRRLRGHHEPQEEAAMHAIVPRLPPAPIVVELGSFWAYYALWACRERPDACVVLVEPDPHNLDVGRRNADLNRMRAATCSRSRTRSWTSRRGPRLSIRTVDACPRPAPNPPSSC